MGTIIIRLRFSRRVLKILNNDDVISKDVQIKKITIKRENLALHEGGNKDGNNK